MDKKHEHKHVRGITKKEKTMENNERVKKNKKQIKK